MVIVILLVIIGSVSFVFATNYTPAISRHLFLSTHSFTASDALEQPTSVRVERGHDRGQAHLQGRPIDGHQ